MAVRRRKAEQTGALNQRSYTRPALAGPGALSARSPALELQGRIAADLTQRGKWPPLATLGFVVGTCGGFWTLVAWGVARLAH